jgi:hypothetical protein
MTRDTAMRSVVRTLVETHRTEPGSYGRGSASLPEAQIEAITSGILEEIGPRMPPISRWNRLELRHANPAIGIPDEVPGHDRSEEPG